MKLTKFTPTGTKTSLTVSDSIFAAPVNKPLLSQAIRVYLANQRQGTSRVKTRGEVSRTKKKWYKQKGTGGARHGARSAPIFVGGGIAHGPKGVTNWQLKLSPVLKNKALISALSVQANNIVVSDEIMALTGKTKSAQALLNTIAPGAKKILVIVNEAKPAMIKALRNIEAVLVTNASRVNALEIAFSSVVIISSDAVKTLETRLESKKSAKITEKPVVKAKAAVTKKSTVKKTEPAVRTKVTATEKPAVKKAKSTASKTSKTKKTTAK